MADQITINVTENKTINVSDVLGNLKITDTAPTAQGLYILSDVGTYTNLGGLVTTADKLNYAYFDGTTWSKVEVAIQRGKSAYEIAVENGFVGTEAQWLASLKPAVLQTMGISTTDAMSQNAITNEFGKVIYVNDAFTSTDTELKIYDVEPLTEVHGSTVLVGFGQLIGVHQNFNKIKIRTKATDDANLPTKVKLRIREEVYNATPILTQEIDVDFSVTKTQDLIWTFPVIENASGKSIWVEYITSAGGGLSLLGDTNTTTEKAMYTTTVNNPNMNAISTSFAKMNIEVFRPGKEYRLKETSLPIIEETPEVEISLPDKIYAVVGDTLQLFYRGIVKAVNPYNYNILINCTKGKQFSRYFEYLPVSGDIGTTGFTIYIKDNNGKIIAEKTCQLITKSAGTSPATMKHIVMAGDSLLAFGQVAIEANRRLTGTGGTPAGRGLTNIAFKGKLTNGNTGFFGAGGWTWTNYTIAGDNWWKVTVNGVNSISFGATYIDSNSNSFEVREVNITSGSGYISLRNISGSATPTGTLTKTAGSGDATVAIISAVSDEANPFWSNGGIDFTTYANNYAGGQIDVFYMLTNWNGLSPNQSDFTSLKSTARTFINAFHTQFPNAKFKILGIQLPSLNGGMSSYGANGGYADVYGMVVTAFNQNKAYQELANETAYYSFVEFVNVSSQFDSENNMPEGDKAVNTRSVETEKIGTNGVHPADSGYNQIADIVYRNFVANFCQ